MTNFHTTQNMTYNPQNRRGAALIIVIGLLACLAIVSGAVLPQILRDRYETRQELVRIQSRQLLGDALRYAEAKRIADPDFAGATLTLGPDSQPFPGTFQVTTKFVDEAFIAEVEYLDEHGKKVFIENR